MRAPFRNDPRDPWDDDEIGGFYRNAPAVAAALEVDFAPDDEPVFPFGFQPPTRTRTTTRPLSRQARAARRLTR